VETFLLHVELPESLDFNSNAILLDGIKVADPAPGQRHKVFLIKPQGTPWQHSLQFQASANAAKHGIFNTTVYGEYSTTEKKQNRTKRIRNSYQASLERSSFRRFSYWPRFASLGSELRNGDIENIDGLLNKLKGETLNHIYIIGHADNMKILDKNKSLFESNQRLSEERAKSTAVYLKEKLNLTEEQLSLSGRGEHEPVAENRTEKGRSINRRVELIVEVLDREDVNRLNIILGDENYSSSKVQAIRHPVKNEFTGVESIRLVTETGRFVDTDEYGLYHFEALKPGTHVVQIDPESIPAHLEPVQCENNTRFAGTPTSRFVEIGSGLIWRANFYFQEKQFPEQTANISLRSKVNEETVSYSLSASGNSGIQRPTQLLINSDKALQLKPESIFIDGQPANATSTEQGIAVALGTHRKKMATHYCIQC
jgi:outer membrane protein OmpA-like peptidoglycan-associated protein